MYTLRLFVAWSLGKVIRYHISPSEHRNIFPCKKKKVTRIVETCMLCQRFSSRSLCRPHPNCASAALLLTVRKPGPVWLFIASQGQKGLLNTSTVRNLRARVYTRKHCTRSSHHRPVSFCQRLQNVSAPSQTLSVLLSILKHASAGLKACFHLYQNRHPFNIKACLCQSHSASATAVCPMGEQKSEI